MSNEITNSVQKLNLVLSKSPYINELDLLSLRERCFNSQPFRYICIDGMWDEDFLTKVSDEVLEFEDWAGEKDFYGSKKKRWQAPWKVYSS